MNLPPKSAALAVLLLAAASLSSCVYPDSLYFPPPFAPLPAVTISTPGYYYGDPYYTDSSYYSAPYYGASYYRTPYYGSSYCRAPYYGASSYRPYYAHRSYGYNR